MERLAFSNTRSYNINNKQYITWRHVMYWNNDKANTSNSCRRVYWIGQFLRWWYCNIYICTSQNIDFTSTSIDYKGRMLYSSDTFSWHVAQSATARMTLSCRL